MQSAIRNCSLLNTSRYAQHPLNTFPRNFAVDGEVANLLRTTC